MAIEGECCSETAALPLKLAAIAGAIAAGAAGVAIPLARRPWRLVKPRGGGGGVLALGRAIAAGAILAAGFVHVLPAASASIASASIAAAAPRGTIWSEFPLAEFAAMVAALGMLAIDSAGTRRHDGGREKKGKQKEAVRLGIGSPGTGESSGAIHIVGVHARAAAHGGVLDEEDASHVRHDVASDHIPVLGIVSRSVIIGLSLGASQSPCVIRPLMVALTFHQFFEGFALGDCISQALFDRLKEVLVATITTPAAIGIGLAVASTYNPDSLTAHIVEGILNSITAGILIYFALIDLIAADFLGNHRRRTTVDGNPYLIWCYISLFLSTALVSLTALWD